MLGLAATVILAACNTSSEAKSREPVVESPYSGDLTIDYCAEMQIDFCGPLFGDAHLALRAQAEAKHRLSVASSGGDMRIGLIAAARIRPENVSIDIHRLCGSACIETLVPAAASVRLIDRPVLVVHGNPSLWRHIIHLGGETDTQCYRSFLFFLDRYLGDRLNPDLVEMQFDRMGIHNIRPGERVRCAGYTFDQEADYILLTAEELQYYYGAPVEGQSAIDDATDIQALVDAWFRQGLRVWARGQIYVSGGSQPGR